jgi:catechol 2,3-dioxygenase-like lactoylglutathione lyase family enzyme
MSLQLYMLGLTVQDMDKSLQFYQRLGLVFPQESEGQAHREVKMGDGLTFFLDSRFVGSDNPDLEEKQQNGYKSLLEFYLPSQAAVDAKYAELIGFGYQSYHTPFVTPIKVYFALVNDPDGNTILLSADVEQ